MRQVCHEITKQDRKENQTEHLAFSSCLNNIGWNHTDEDFGNVACTLVTYFRDDLINRSR